MDCSRYARHLHGLIAFAIASVLAGGVAQAADKYYSDCGAGFIWGLSAAGDATPANSEGAACDLPGTPDSCLDSLQARGTRENPWCLNPGSLQVGPVGAKYGLNNSFMQHIGTFAAGDNIILCSEACDTVGASYFPLALAPGVTGFLKPTTSGTLGNPITVEPYCNGGACDTIVFTGDSNFCSSSLGCPGFHSTSDGNDYSRFNNPTNYLGQAPVPESGDLAYFLDTNGQQYWRISGGRNDAGGDAARTHLIVERFTGSGQDVLHMYGNPTGWTLDGFELRRMTGLMWNLNNLADTNPECQDNGGYLMHTDQLAGALVVKDMVVHHICSTFSRNNNHVNTASTLVQGNLFYNVAIVQQDFNNYNETWQGNTILDCWQCINFEDDTVNAVIQDNVVGCPGTYRVKNNGHCLVGISLTNGNNNEADVVTHDVIIRRNKVFGQVAGDYGGGTVGWFFNPVTVQLFSSSVANNILIENNMVWHGQGWSSPESAGPGIWVQVERATGSEVVIQNNTVYDTKYGIRLDGYATGVDMLVQDNLIYRSNKNNSPTVGLTVGPNATTSRIKTNLITNGALGGNIIDNNGVLIVCAGIAAFNNGTTRTGNFCNSTNLAFETVSSGLKVNWDLHLSPTVGNPAVDSGTAAATEDIDGEARPNGGVADIGADEIYSPYVPIEPGGSIIPLTRRPPIRVN